MRSRRSQSPCYRIDPVTGERTKIRKPPPKAPAVYKGHYGLWNDLTQAWDGGPYASLTTLAAAIYDGGDHLTPSRWGGEYNPKPLTLTEWRKVRQLMEAAG